MSEADRRFQRYALTPGAFSKQRVKACGLLGALKGWNTCRVKDMSAAGALVLSKQILCLGDKIVLELTKIDEVQMLFNGEVVNLGKDHTSGLNKLGVRIAPPAAGSAEALFLEKLQELFRPSV